MIKYSIVISSLFLLSCSQFSNLGKGTYETRARRRLIEFSPILQECYTNELIRTKKSFHGSVTFKIDITNSGRVKLVEVLEDQLGSNRIKGCFVKTIHKIKFPTHTKQEIVQLRQPFNFKLPETFKKE